MKSRGSIKIITKFSKPDPLLFITLLFATLGCGIYRYLVAETYTNIVNDFSTFTTETFIRYGILLIIFLCIGGLSTYLKDYISEKLNQYILKSIQNRVRNVINRGNFRQIDLTEYGKYNTLITADTELIAGFYSNIVFPMMNGVLQFSLAMYFVVKNSWELALIILCISLFSIFVPKLFKSKLKDAKQVVQNKDEALRTFFSHSLERVALIKSYNSKKLEERALNSVHKKYCESLIKQQIEFAKMLSFNNLTTYLIISVQAFIEIWFVLLGKLSIGAMTGLAAVSNSLSWPFWMLPSIIATLAQTEVAAERIDNFISESTVSEVSNLLVDHNIPVIKGENISFSYDSENVLNDFSFEINRNEILGLTWKSGEGKSTFIKILAGLYSPQTGQLIKNHANMKISYATQNELFFSDCVGNNISLSFDNDQSILNHSLEKASVDFLRNGTKLSLDTELNKTGQPLSGGQKKRINLARAFYHDSDILILDEPTASLDSETKKSVLEAIKTEKKKRTIILITHDQQTFRICDRFLEKEPKKELAIL
jgi:ABC-type multidrug transport system fused ATPase/permease subunit